MPEKTIKNETPEIGNTRIVDMFGSAYDVYIGGPHDGSDPRLLAPGQLGFLGNPFTSGSLEDRLSCFEAYFDERTSSDRRFLLAVLSLYGKRLGCMCEDERCHGELIVAWLNRHRAMYQAWYGARTAVRSR